MDHRLFGQVSRIADRRTGGSNAVAHSGPNPHADAGPNAVADPGPNTHADSHSHTDAGPNPHADAGPNAVAHSDPNTHADADSHADARAGSSPTGPDDNGRSEFQCGETETGATDGDVRHLRIWWYTTASVQMARQRRGGAELVYGHEVLVDARHRGHLHD